MDFPEDLKRKIAKRAEHDAKIAKQKQLALQAAKDKQAEIEKFRQKNKKKLLALAKFAARWINDFFGSEFGKKAIQVSYGELSIFFCGKAYGGDPYEVLLYEDGMMRLGESAKFAGGFHYICDFGAVPIQVETLFENLHPEYLRLFVEHLKSGKVWEYIKMEMKE